MHDGHTQQSKLDSKIPFPSSESRILALLSKALQIVGTMRHDAKVTITLTKDQR